MATDTQDFTETNESSSQRLTDAAGEIAQQATSAAEQRASSTMTQVGDTLEQVAAAVRGAGDNLRAEQPQLAGFADTAAKQVESAAQFLRDHDAREVIDGAQDFARRQPAVVVGAGLALGLLVGRALKSANVPTSRYGATGSYGASAYGTSSSYEAAGGYGTSGDYTGGAATSSVDADRADDLSASSDTAPEGER